MFRDILILSMVQESTVICIDNSDWMRNGDLSPNRFQCEQEAVRSLIQSKLRSNPENAVALLSMASNVNVIASLTSEDRKVVARMNQADIGGSVDVVRSIKTAHLVLKNRSNRNHKMRIVVFIGSPLDPLVDEYGSGEFLKLAKKLKKENVKVDFVLFGEATSVKNQLIIDFVDVINGADGVGSNVVVMSADTKLYEVLLSSPICRGEGGGAPAGEFEFGIDPDEDPELALALRVSMEEQRQRQQQADAVAAAAAGNDADGRPPAGAGEAMDVDDKTAGAGLSSRAAASSQLQIIDEIDPAAMTEEEQLQWALRMSMGETLNDDTSMGVVGAIPSSSSTNVAGSRGVNLLQPIASAGGAAEGRAIQEGNKVDDEVLSSAGATASGTPAPTPMEDEAGGGEGSNAIGQLMRNMDLLQQLVDQIPEPDSVAKKKDDNKEAGKK